ncbi:GAF domain-containing protein [Qipengyuania flava]|uniref:GAF domain-containing protein n=1 Tax=Qipengyuania flava TaxID=192812 RepID=UPI001CFD206F|nr:GAF domain-containing protein [Qipengyuania flava]
MFDFRPAADTPKPEAYRQLVDAAEALTAGEPDGVANMANMAALLWDFLPDLNWAGFYRVVEDELVLGPFMGRPACIRIPMGQGVCGTAAKDAATQLVEDVHAFPGHIACDAVTSSELVVPVVRDGTVIAVIDLDSPAKARFDAQDAAGIEALAAAIAKRI